MFLVFLSLPLSISFRDIFSFVLPLGASFETTLSAYLPGTRALPSKKGTLFSSSSTRTSLCKESGSATLSPTGTRALPSRIGTFFSSSSTRTWLCKETGSATLSVFLLCRSGYERNSACTKSDKLSERVSACFKNLSSVWFSLFVNERFS